MNKRHRYISFMKLFPNIITLSSLCFGVLAVYHSTMMHWDRACFFIIAAAIFDTLDGRFARMLNAHSNFGANLDSLCDFANYTIFPAMIVYNWSLWSDGIFGWSAVMVSSVCGAIRLARFNVKDSITQHPVKKRFFCGVPSPAAGILIILPLIIQIGFGRMFNGISIQYPPYYLYEIYTCIISFLMVGTFPTLSLKYLRIPKKYTGVTLVAIGFIIISFFVFKWKAVVFYSLLYVGLMPIVLLKYYMLLKRYNNEPK
jgi:CDP-diacylglycerol--serine O-phosphatidyltransferase